MKQLIIFTSLAILTSYANAQDIEAEKEQIKQVVQTAYVEGLQNEGDLQKIESGFHPDFNLLGIGEGDQMWKYPIAEWKANQVKKLEAGELPLKGKKKVSVEFKQVDVTGTAAVVKLEFYVGKKLTYVDYLSLYKFDDGWKIVSKIFYKI